MMSGKFLHFSKRSFSLQVVRNAKKAGKREIGAKPGGGVRGKVIAEPEPVTDANLLVNYCCGLNKFNEGSDPQLQPEETYPDWLWSLHVGKPQTYLEMDESSKDFWYSLKETRESLDVAEKSGQKGYFRPYRESELNFISRLSKRSSK